ncbi:chemotaxis protein CheB [Hymenobacter sp. YC55]|uniref:CheB methylesterase domain-containing protein n=1 Tax=Hymenobacter sp. YC55 TaxID=3034019 RepID=UPI0023FA229C|nr:chemotaxis protein CheB [Hymenobacter sp. YC55]MDF7811194.1 chemotaxis protein CheB [Hymenobacter sp. YC55]
MPDIPVPQTVLLGSLPTAGRLALTRLLQQLGLRVTNVSEDPTEFITQVRRLRPALLIVGERQLRGLEVLSRHVVLPVLLYCESQPLPGMMREASRWGVFDYILAGAAALEWSNTILRKLEVAPVQPVSSWHSVSRAAAVPGLPSGVVVIGGSTGSPEVVEQLVRSLPATLACAVVVAVHLPASFLNSFVKRLARASSLPVIAAGAGTQLTPGCILVAPGGHNLVVRSALHTPWQCWQTDFSTESSPSGDEPSIDILMRSVAHTVGNNVLGVVLTGMGRDGTLGAQAIRQHGGTVLAQDEASSVLFSMPNSVIQAGWANAVLPLVELPEAIVQYTAQFRRTASGVRSTRFSVPSSCRLVEL